MQNYKKIKEVIKEKYKSIAVKGSGCGCNNSEDISKNIGYSDDDIAIGKGANLGLGCGNPVALSKIKQGDTVLDLGCGAGFDCFLASKKAGKDGKVIGIDMTEEMIKKARLNAKKMNIKNVEFILSEIEKLPIDNNSIDIIITNCVINLTPDKTKAFQEAYRVLKRGGRLMVSDLVLAKDLPKEIKNSVEAYVGCLAGAIKKKEYLRLIEQAKFKNVKVISESSYPVSSTFGNFDAAQDAILSVKVEAVKK